MLNGRVKPIAILMDECEAMNAGDKGGITSLIKLIRQKKTMNKCEALMLKIENKKISRSTFRLETSRAAIFFFKAEF